MSESPTFVYLLRPRRPDFIATMTPDEGRTMGEHFSYLQGMLAAGKLVLAGPALDAAFGVVIFEASSRTEAAGLMEADPAVRGGIMTAELHPFRVSLQRA